VPVYFHSEDTRFELKGKKIYKQWVEIIVQEHHKTVQNLNIIFSSNEYLLELNRKYLNHNYYTDVITFDYTIENAVSGDIFVSIDQVRLNCQDQEVTFENELARVMIHGVLHLLGYDDSTHESAMEMRLKEDWALKSLREVEDGKDI
jgi:probable rRNA maturation factor